MARGRQSNWKAQGIGHAGMHISCGSRRPIRRLSSTGEPRGHIVHKDYQKCSAERAPDISKKFSGVLFCSLGMTIEEAVTENGLLLAMVVMGPWNSRDQVVAHNCPAEALYKIEKYKWDPAYAEEVVQTPIYLPGWYQCPSFSLNLMLMWMAPQDHLKQKEETWVWFTSGLSLNVGESWNRWSCITVPVRGDV